MPALQHVYLTAHGTWNASNWAGETAQIGLRLCFAPSASAPAKGSVFTPLTHGDVATDTGTASGTHGTLTKTWTARLGETGSTANFDATQQVGVAEDMWTFLNAVKPVQYLGFQWTHVKIAPILADGKYGAPAALYQFTSVMPGTAAGSNKAFPPEVALAVSLRAPVIGRRGRGRFYLPGLSGLLGESDGTFNATGDTTVRPSAVTLISNLENASGLDLMTPVVAVMSAGSTTAVRPSQVRVGNHFDAQRRRQHQVAEVYGSTTL